MMREITGLKPEMWGPSIIGFGDYHYRYDSGREGDMFLTGFSPRKQSLSLYIMAGFDSYDDLLARLGKHRKGASCLYINKLADVDMDVLRELVRESFEHAQANAADLIRPCPRIQVSDPLSLGSRRSLMRVAEHV